MASLRSTLQACFFLLPALLLACGGDPGAQTSATSGGSSGGGGSGGEASTSVGSGASGGGGGGGSGGSSVSVGGGSGGPDCEVFGVPGDCIEVAECDALPSHTSTAGKCPGAASIQCCTPYGEALCNPDFVHYPNWWNTTEALGKGGCPGGMIAVADFCIDQFEATLVRADDGTSWSPYVSPGLTGMVAVSVKGAVPQGYINGVEADDACTNAGKRLCTDAEWLRACQGPSGDTYPYGDSKQLGVCNDHRGVHPAVQYFNSTESWIFSEIDNACLNQLPEGLGAAGEYDGCETAEGAFDMMGNLHEWTADPSGTFRGGFYVDTVLNGPGCLYKTSAHDVFHWDYSTGFRCCADP